MKRHYLFILLALIAYPLLSQTTLDVKPEIKSVTVYLRGAQITRSADINLSEGKNTLLLKGLSPQIDPQSIQVKLDKDVLVESVTHDIDYLNKLEVDQRIHDLSQQKRNLIDSLNLLKNYKKVYQEEKAMILANKSIKGDQGLQISELTKASDFYRQRLQEIENALFDNEMHSRGIKKRLVDVAQTLLDESLTADEPSSVIQVIVSTKAAITSPLEVKYVVSDASWTPTYDLRVDEVDQPLNLQYKANVRQSTGEEWKDVQLTLSTGNPFVSNDKPELETYYLSFNNNYQKRQYNTPVASKNGMKIISGVVTDTGGEPLIGATILAKEIVKGTVTDFDGRYQLEVPMSVTKLVVSYTGFETQEIHVGSYASKTVNVSMEEGVFLNEVVVTGLSGRVSGLNIRGSRKKAKGYYVDGLRVEKQKMIPISIEKSHTTTQFEIEIPYTIPTDGEDYAVTMVAYEVPTQYHYSCVPKLSDQAYLVAQFTDWYQYRLLSGQVHLFYNGIYQGDTYMDMETVSDTISISIGKDEDVVIKREVQEDFSRTQTIGSHKKVTRAWQTEIKNNKKVPIRIVVEDQYPISKVNDIKVSLEGNSGATVNENNGKLKWDINLPAGMGEKLLIKYAVKYPKKRNLIVE